MNLNLHFDITSDHDIVLDRKNFNPAILMDADESST